MDIKPNPPQGRLRIWLIEDQLPMIKVLQRALGKFADFEVVGFSNTGEEGVLQVLKEKPDLLLLDLELPGQDGVATLHELTRLRALPTTLILTSFDNEEKVYRALEAGASGYLVKRAGTESLRSAILEAVAGGIVIEPQLARRFWNYFQSVQGRQSQANPWNLSALEQQLLAQLARGLSNSEAGLRLNLAPRATKTHLSHIYRKMGVRTHVEAVVEALKSGLIGI